MIWIILFTIGGIGFTAWVQMELSDTVLGKIAWCVFMVPLGALVGCLIGCLLAIFCGVIGSNFVEMETVVVRDDAIYSLTDSATASRRFTLGTGYYDEDLCIYYVTEKDSVKEIQRVSRSHAHIIESDEEEPHVVVTEKHYKHKWVNWFMFDISWGNGGEATLTVPVGTVTTQYNIDLE